MSARARLPLAGLCLSLLVGCTDYRSLRLDDTGTWPAGEPASAGAGTTTAAPGRHLVLPGETLSELAEQYEVPLSRLIQVNRVRKPYHI